MKMAEGTRGKGQGTRRTAGVLAGIVGLLLAAPVQAEWYLAGDLLQARFAGPTVDGTWKQEYTPSQDGKPAMTQTLQSLAWDVGAGYRFADGAAWYTQSLSVEGGYRHWGNTLSAGGLAVSDDQYHQVTTRQVGPAHYEPAEYDATDRLQGGYLRMTKGFAVGGGVEPYVAVGAFVAYHDLQGWWRHPAGGSGAVGYTGVVAGPTVGGGLKYELVRGIRARVGVESHWSLTESGHPISSQWLTVGGGIEVPLAVFTSVEGSGRDYLWQR